MVGSPILTVFALSAARRQAFDAAQRDWPSVQLEFDSFCRHLDSLGHDEALPDEAASLFLCAACAERIPAAVAALENLFFPMMGQAVRRIMHDDLVDDVLQDVRRRLFAESPPRIASYRGDAPLGTWLRVVAVHVALDYRRARAAREQRARELPTWHGSLADAGEASRSPDELMFERGSVGLLERELYAAVRKLGGEERRLLHLHLVQGMSIDVLAQMYAVDRSTVARRVRRHLDGISGAVLQSLTAELGPLRRDELSTLGALWHRYSDGTAESLFGLGPAPAANDAVAGARIRGRARAVDAQRPRRERSARSPGGPPSPKR